MISQVQLCDIQCLSAKPTEECTQRNRRGFVKVVSAISLRAFLCVLRAKKKVGSYIRIDPAQFVHLTLLKQYNKNLANLLNPNDCKQDDFFEMVAETAATVYSLKSQPQLIFVFLPRYFNSTRHNRNNLTVFYIKKISFYIHKIHLSQYFNV